MRTKSLHIAGRAAVLGAFAVPMAMAGNAAAAECSTLPKPVVIVGSSAVEAFMAVIAPALAANVDENDDPDPITIVYQKPGSCIGATYLASPATTGTVTGTAEIWDTSGDLGSCDISSALAVNIGVSDVFPASCGFDVLPNKVKDFHGPVQTMTFAVSTASSRQVISAEAAYLTFGLGDQGASPWDDPTKYWVRDSTSGTQQMLAHAIGVPATNFFGTHSSNNSIIAALQASASDQNTADASIGLLGMDGIKGNSAADVIPLQYQHYGQSCGYYPSSDLTSNDMQNTRDGHYMIQGPIHLLTKVDNSGIPTNANAKILIDYLTAAVIPTNFDLIQLEASRAVVPDCAMRVTRDEEIGPFMSYMPAVSCECKFLKEATGDVPDECTTCDPANGNDDCTDSARPHCNYGYCEVQ